MRQENHRLGALFAVAAALMFASMGAAIKVVSVDLPNETIVFFRNLFGLLALAPLLLREGRGNLRTVCFRLHVLRGISGLAAMYCFFYAIAHLHLAEAVLLSYTTPLFAPLIALAWLGEPIPRRLRMAVMVGFAGVIFVLKPGPLSFSSVALIGLASGLFAALALITVRRMSGTEPIVRIVFYFGLISTLVSAVPLVWSWTGVNPRQLGLLLAIGMMATAGQLCMTKAYALAPAARVGPFTYASVIFAAVYGWLFWRQLPDVLSFAGTLLVVSGGALAFGRGVQKASTSV